MNKNTEFQLTQYAIDPLGQIILGQINTLENLWLQLAVFLMECYLLRIDYNQWKSLMVCVKYVLAKRRPLSTDVFIVINLTTYGIR